jgi:hypothetical protein
MKFGFERERVPDRRAVFSCQLRIEQAYPVNASIKAESSV